MGPFQTVTIPYRVTAQHPGRFVNSVVVDARSVDGPLVQPVRASSVIEVGEPAECESTACGLWSPPAWEFEYLKPRGRPDLRSNSLAPAAMLVEKIWLLAGRNRHRALNLKSKKIACGQERAPPFKAARPIAN